VKVHAPEELEQLPGHALYHHLLVNTPNTLKMDNLGFISK
jgi:hypothetical protein